MNVKAIFWLAASIIGHVASYAQGTDRSFWQTDGATNEEIRVDFSVLFSAMRSALNEGIAVPTRKVTIASFEYDKLKAELRANQLYGGVFPDELAFLTCELNKDQCAVKQSGSGSPKTIWSNQAREVLVPDIRVVPNEQLKPYLKSKGESIDSIVVNKRRVCDSYDSACRALLSHLNAERKLQPNWAGQVLVPNVGYSAHVPTQLLDAKRGAVRENVVKSVQSGGGQSTSAASPGVIDRTTLQRLISYQDEKNGHEVVVGVLDGIIEPAHCFFRAQQVTTIANDVVNIGHVGKTHECGWISSDELSPPSNHGTHVAALIGAQRSIQGGSGINPEASIVAASVDTSAIGLPENLARTAYLLGQLYKKSSVVNLSWDYQPKQAIGRLDPVANAISDSAAGQILTVVAAGNRDMVISDQSNSGCIYLPQCLNSLPNVLTVTALSNSLGAPTLWQGKDARTGVAGGPGVAVGVPADHILSAAWEGGAGQMSGTSQAAAIASGAASLLYAKRPTLEPLHVRNRIVYTSDGFESLDGALFGGRLNIARALAFDTFMLRLASTTEVFPKAVVFTKSITFTNIDSGEDVPVPRQSLKRMTLRHTSKGDFYDVYYIGGVQSNTLMRMRARMLPGFARKSFASFYYTLPDGRVSRPLALTEIEDYVAKIPAAPQ